MSSNVRAVSMMVGVGAVLLGWSIPAAAQQPAAAQPLDPQLLARLAAEKEARKSCKTEICKVLSEKKGEGTINCEVTKTWLQSEIQQRILRDKLSWPWGHALCTAKVDIDRSDLAKLVSGPETTAKLRAHKVSCSLDRKAPETGEAYAVKVTITPEVTFKDGKATKVVAGWSNIEAPMLAKGPIWAATATDNNFGVLNSALVGELNTFMFSHCEEVGIKIPEPN